MAGTVERGGKSGWFRLVPLGHLETVAILISVIILIFAIPFIIFVLITFCLVAADEKRVKTRDSVDGSTLSNHGTSLLKR